jgi:hypothetical protein
MVEDQPHAPVPAGDWTPTFPEVTTLGDLARPISPVAELVDHLSAPAARLGAPARPTLFSELVDWQDHVSRWIPAAAVIQEAERTLVLAEVDRHRQAALTRLARRSGLAWTRLHPRGTTPYLVANNGVEIGTVRAATTHWSSGTIRHSDWVATPKDRPLDTLGPSDFLRAAAEALARATHVKETT